MKIDEIEIYDLPEWSASAVINNDFSGLNAEETEQVKFFLAYMEGATMSIKDGDAYFCHYPIFGLPTTCVEMEAIYMK